MLFQTFYNPAVITYFNNKTIFKSLAYKQIGTNGISRKYIVPALHS